MKIIIQRWRSSKEISKHSMVSGFTSFPQLGMAVFQGFPTAEESPSQIYRHISHPSAPPESSDLLFSSTLQLPTWLHQLYNAAEMLTSHLMLCFWILFLSKGCISTLMQPKILTCPKHRPPSTWRKKSKLSLVYVMMSYWIGAVFIQTPRRNKHNLSNIKTKALLERENLLRHKRNPREIHPSGVSSRDEWEELSEQRGLLEWSASITTTSPAGVLNSFQERLKCQSECSDWSLQFML